MSGSGRVDLRIMRVEAVPVALPVRRDWRWRGLQGALGRWVIVRVYTDEGLVGLGEATPLPDWGGDFNRYAGETPETVAHVVGDHLGPLLSGVDPFDVEATVDRMDGVVSGHLYAKAAVEMALYDLQGKATGQPLFRLLGGRYRSGVRVAHMIGLMEREEAIEEASAALEDGCTAFQIKAEGQLDRDASVTRALREMVGPEVLLRVDANQGYGRSGVKEAIRAVMALEDAGADYVEQPTEGLSKMSGVTEAVGGSIIADESAWQPQDVLEIARKGAADAISVYVAKAGGLLRAKKVAVVAETCSLPCDVNGSLESGVGNAANVHLATACPAITLPSVIPVTTPAEGPNRTVGRYYTDDLVTEPFAFESGMLFAPEEPGLGVKLDEEKLEAYRVDRSS